MYVQFHAMLHICVVSIDQNSVGQWICISSGPPDFLFCLYFVEAVEEKKIEGKIRQIAADEANFFQDCCTTTVSVTSVKGFERSWSDVIMSYGDSKVLIWLTKVELVSKELNQLVPILHVYAGGLNFMK